MNRFQNLKISIKINLGYLVALILMIFVGGVALVRLQQVDDTMAYIANNLIQDEALVQEIETQILEIRLQTNRYIRTQNPDDLASYQQHWESLEKLLASAEASITEDKQLELLKQIKTDTTAYGTAFTEITDLMAKRQQVKAEVLDVQGQQALDLLNQLQINIAKTYNPSAINHIANVQKTFLLIQLNVYKYLIEGDEQWTAQVDEHKTQFQAALAELDTTLKDMNQRQMMETSKTSVEEYITAFESLKSAYRRQHELQANILDVLGLQIRATAIAIVNNMTTVMNAETAAGNNLVAQTRFVLIATILIAVVIGLGLGFLISRGITRPLQAVTKVSQQIVNVDLPSLTTALSTMAQGDLTRKVSVTAQPLPLASGDEVGMMTGAFNTIIERLQEANLAFEQMALNLRHLVGQVTENAHSVSAASGQLASTAEQAGQATAQITTTIQQVAHGTTQQTDSVNRASLIVEQVSRAIESVANGAQEQAVSVSKSSDFTNQLVVAIQQVATNAQAGAQGATKAAQTARNGSNTVHATIQGMATIKAKVGLSVQKVQEMGQRSNQIGAIVQTIDDIASQTNLLALNAAIEAARAGEHGKGFAVVADEVRKLAEKSAEATKEITGLIHGIQQTVSEAVAAMEAGAAEVENGASRANEAGQALAAILEAVESVNQQVGEISTAVQHMSDSSNQLVSAMDTVSAVVEENTAATEEMAASSGEITQVMDNITSISEANSAAIEEVSASTEEMNAQVEEVTASAQALSQMAQALLQVVAQFKTDETGDQVEVQILSPTPAKDVPPTWNQSKADKRVLEHA